MFILLTFLPLVSLHLKVDRHVSQIGGKLDLTVTMCFLMLAVVALARLLMSLSDHGNAVRQLKYHRTI